MHEPAARRRRLRTAALAGGVALGLTLLVSSPAIAAPSSGPVLLTVSPAAEVGDTVDVSLTLPATTDVYAYEIDLSVDPAALGVVAGSSTGPAGGFDSLDTDTSDGVVALVHTRLGTSPGLAGDITASLQLTALAAGTTSVGATVTLVDATGARTPVAGIAPAVVVVAAPPAPPTSPAPTPTAAPTSTPGATSTPSATPAPAAVSAGNGGPLAVTGQSAVTLGLIGLAAIAALAVGLVAVFRRRAGDAR